MVICGWNSRSFALLDFLLSDSPLDKPRIVLVNTLSVDNSARISNAYPGQSLHFVYGDFIDESVLKQANIVSAKSAIIVPDDSPYILTEGRGCDERTIIGALAIKALNPDINLGAIVLKSENEVHLRRTHADTVVVNGEFSEFLLAQASSWPYVPAAVRAILSPKSPHGLHQLAIPGEFTGKSFAELGRHLQQHDGLILIGVLSAGKAAGLNALLTDEDSDTDSYIKRKFQEADIDLQDPRSALASVLINPGAAYLIGPYDAAFVIG